MYAYFEVSHTMTKCKVTMIFRERQKNKAVKTTFQTKIKVVEECSPILFQIQNSAKSYFFQHISLSFRKTFYTFTDTKNQFRLEFANDN